MELWVRSQNKEDLIKVDNLGLAYRGKYNFMDKIGDIDNYCICQFIDDYHVKLGTYETKERALEVLDEIDEFIDLFQRNGFGNVLSDDGVHPKHTIYEMPEK